MKKFLLSLLLCFGAVQISTAQLDSELVTQFLNAVVEKDGITLLDLLHPDDSKEINKLIEQSNWFNFQGWNFALAKKIPQDDGSVITHYLVAMQIGLDLDDIPNEIWAYLTPSGHVFLYEIFYVAEYNGHKYVHCNADFLEVSRVEEIMFENGTELHASYYEPNY